jgi:DNA-binding NarL/FixJ family response regulator
MRIFLIGLGEGLARSLARYLRSNPDVALTGVAPSLALAELMLPATRSALVLVDWAALGASPREGVRALRRDRPGLRIVCVVSESEAYGAVALEVGADAVIVLDRLAMELELLLRSFFPERIPAGGIGAGHHD